MILTGHNMTMSPANIPSKKPDLIDPQSLDNNFSGFEFSFDDQVSMLPADELFSNGKLIPLHLHSKKSIRTETEGLRTFGRLKNEVSVKDPCLFSPKAPKCSSRWKELLGLKRLNQREKENRKTTLSTTTTSSSAASKSIKSFINRSLKPSLLDSSLNLPLLKEEDTESVSVSSSRMSLSSSSSSHDHDDLPRNSLDSEVKQGTFSLPRVSLSRKHSSMENPNPGVRVSTSQTRKHGVRQSSERTQSLYEAEANSVPRVSVDSPRMNSSGKIVFQSLERSTSTPNTRNGGRYKNRGIERSYSAHVRITAVPVCSLRRSSKSAVVFGFPLFSKLQQSNNGTNKTSRIHHQQYLQKKNSNSKNRIEKLTESKQ